MAERELDLEVEEKLVVSRGVVELTLRGCTQDELPQWEPGAHIDLMLTPELVRQYSLCGDPSDRSRYTVAIHRNAGGRGGSEYVHSELREGDRIRVRGPRNHFSLVDAERYVFIAGGIGITPILPMIRQLHEAGADWQLFYGGRSRACMAYIDDVEQIATEGRVLLLPADEVGMPDLDVILAGPMPGTAVYCCGPEPLLVAVEERCREWPPGALHVERFAPRAEEAARPQKAFEVELARTGVVLAVPADRSILEVVLEHGVAVESSCRAGTCATCETRVVAGLPDHRDSVLDDEERAANETVMICVSRSHSARLVLDM